MINKIRNVLVSSALVATVFASTGITAYADGDQFFSATNGPYTFEEHVIGFGGSVTIDVPQANSDFATAMDSMVDGVEGLSKNHDTDTYTYRASDGNDYTVDGIQDNRADSDPHRSPNVADPENYYLADPALSYVKNNNGTITVTENSNSNADTLGGLIVDQSDRMQWNTQLRLTSEGSSEFRYLNVYTGKVYVIRIRENWREPIYRGYSDDNGGNDSESSSNEVVIEVSPEEAQQLLQFYQTNSTVAVGTTPVKSTLDGNFTATSVAGAAITTPKADIASALGLKEGETAKIATWDITPTSSPYAYDSLVAGAKSIGGEMGPAIQVNITKSGADVRYIHDTFDVGGTVNMVVGIPASFYQEGAEYAVVHVIGGGKYEILEDNDDDPLTISFPVSGGYGAYALVRIK